MSNDNPRKKTPFKSAIRGGLAVSSFGLLALIVGAVQVAATRTFQVDDKIRVKKRDRITSPVVRAPRAFGGPDAHGYSFIDSDETNGPAFGLIDLTGTGTPFTLTDDDVSSAISLPITFRYYGVDYTEIYVSSNGWVTPVATTNSACCTGEPFPTPSSRSASRGLGASPDAIIGAWWEDLHPEEGAYKEELTHGSAGVRGTLIYVIEFLNVPHYGAYSDVVTFQVHLYPSIAGEDSNIEVHYLMAPSDGGTHTAGIENQDGTIGLEYFNGTGSLANNLAVRYTKATVPVELQSFSVE